MRQGTFVSVSRPFFSPFNEFSSDYEKEFDAKLLSNSATRQLLEKDGRKKKSF